MVRTVLEEHSVSVFTGSWEMEAVNPDRNLGTHALDYRIL
jgi:hypothetical protein